MIPAPAQRRGRLGTLALLLLLLPLAASGASGLAGCYDFTYVEPAQPLDAEAPDARLPDAREPEAGEAGPGCTVGVESCGGDGLRGDPDILYRCLPDGGGALLRKCASGCLHDAGPGTSGRCAMPVNPCILGGFYCGGDKLDGDPAVLYTCGTGGTAMEKERCTKGCQVMKSPDDDECVR